MSFWDRLKEGLDLLQKPAGAYAGLMGGAYKALGGSSLDPEGQLGYDDPLEGLIKGWNKPEGMYRTMNKLYGDYKEPGVLESLIGGVNDIGYDPLILTGPMGGSSSLLKDVPVLGKIAEGAGAAGKLGDEASILTKGGQYGRRYLTGLRLTGDPISAIGVATAQGAAERGLTGLAKSRALTNVLSKGSKVAEPLLEEGVDAAGEALAKTPTTAAAQVEDALAATAKAKPEIKAPKANTTPLQNMEQATGVKNPTTLDLARSVLPASEPKAEKAAVNKLLALRDQGLVTPEAVATATPRKQPPVITAPKDNPNIQAMLGTPGAKQDLYESALGPNLSQSDMPGFLRRGPTTPQEAAIQKIVENHVASDFDDWRRAAIGPFTPTAQSEQTMLPEQLAYFLQNYGQ